VLRGVLSAIQTTAGGIRGIDGVDARSNKVQYHSRLLRKAELPSLRRYCICGKRTAESHRLPVGESKGIRQILNLGLLLAK
jgi:hypothetical protein